MFCITKQYKINPLIYAEFRDNHLYILLAFVPLLGTP